MSGWVLALIAVAVPAVAQKQDAEAAVKAHQWKLAEALYQQVVAKEPGDGNSWFELGSAAAQAGDWKTAEAGFEKAYALKSRSGFALYNLVCVEARLGNKDKAFETLDTLAKFAPGFVTQVEKDEDVSSLRSDARYEASVRRMKVAMTPCEFDERSRQLDFWIGDWDVFAPNGAKVGTSHIERALSGCLLIENWEGLIGGSGKSFNTYNAGTGKWKQFWVASGGAVTEYEGEFKDGSMQFVGKNYLRGAATPGMVRLTFTPLEGGKVRQHGESTSDQGATWTTNYDFTYVPKSSLR